MPPCTVYKFDDLLLIENLLNMYVVQRWKEECEKCLTLHLFQPFLWGKILLCISNLICRAPAPASSRDDTHISRKNTLCFAKFPVSQMQNYETKTYFFSFVKQLHYVSRNFVFFQFRKTIWNMFLVFSYFFCFMKRSKLVEQWPVWYSFVFHETKK